MFLNEASKFIKWVGIGHDDIGAVLVHSLEVPMHFFGSEFKTTENQVVIETMVQVRLDPLPGRNISNGRTPDVKLPSSGMPPAQL